MKGIRLVKKIYVVFIYIYILFLQSQNNSLNFVIELVTNCTKVKTLILGVYIYIYSQSMRKIRINEINNIIHYKL